MTALGSISVEQAELEAAHVAFVKEWSGRIGSWTLRAADLQREREALEGELTSESSSMVMRLMRLGYGLEAAQLRVEALLEQAFGTAAQ